MIHSSSNFATRVKQDLPPDYPLSVEERTIPADESKFGKLVYMGSISSKVYASKLISLSSTAIGIGIQPGLMKYMAENSFPLPVQVVLETFCGFFVFITPFLLHFVARRYIMRLYFDPETKIFTAVSLRFMPVKKFTKFTREDVEVPPIPGMFTSITVRQGQKKQPFFINPPEFIDNEAYKILMSYDLPMDILRNDDAETKKKN